MRAAASLTLRDGDLKLTVVSRRESGNPGSFWWVWIPAVERFAQA